MESLWLLPETCAGVSSMRGEGTGGPLTTGLAQDTSRRAFCQNAPSGGDQQVLLSGLEEGRDASGWCTDDAGSAH